MSTRATHYMAHLQLKDPSTKLVGLLLTSFVDNRGLCWPSQILLSQMSGLSERTVRRHLRILEELGVIQTLTQRTSSGQKRNSYVFDVSQINAFWDETRPANGDIPPVTGDRWPTGHTAQPTGQMEQATGHGCPVNIYPSINQSINQEGDSHQQVDIETLIDQSEIKTESTDQFSLEMEKEPTWQDLEKSGKLFSCPPDWQPNLTSMNYAKQLGLTDQEIAIAVSEFVAYWAADKTRRKGWDKTFVKNLKNQVSRIKRAAQQPTHGGHNHEANQRISRAGIWQAVDQAASATSYDFDPDAALG